MATYATITVGYNVFLLPAKEAQAVFEALTGRGVEIDYFSADETAAAGTTRGRGMTPNETRVACELLSVDDMHAALDRSKAMREHREAMRDQPASEAAE